MSLQELMEWQAYFRLEEKEQDSIKPGAQAESPPPRTANKEVVTKKLNSFFERRNKALTAKG